MSQNVPDQEPGVRVLVLGMSRTGTTSMLMALEKLGYKTYHMHVIIKNPSHFPIWTDALRAKDDGTTTSNSAPDFDRIFKGYGAVSDAPVIMFSPELIAKYPDAKVILTTRNKEKWIESMQSSIWRVH